MCASASLSCSVSAWRGETCFLCWWDRCFLVQHPVVEYRRDDSFHALMFNPKNTSPIAYSTLNAKETSR